jgi:hypothetical protein
MALTDDDRPRLRYVVLHHVGIDAPHFDILLEQEPGSPTLWTFRSPTWPIESETPLIELEDHRRAYLDYEGPISGGRGSVTRVEAGEYVLLTTSPRSAKSPRNSQSILKLRLWHDDVEAAALVHVSYRGEWVVRPVAPDTEP